MSHELDIGLRVTNLAEFNAALREYQETGHKEFADVLTQKAGDVALRAAQFVEVGSKSRLSPQPTNIKTWCAHIANVLKQGYTLNMRRRTKDNKWVQDSAGSWYHRKHKGVRVTHKGAVGGDVTKAQARRVSAAIIRRRRARFGGLRAPFLYAASSLGKSSRAGLGVIAEQRRFETWRANGLRLSAGFAFNYGKKPDAKEFPAGTPAANEMLQLRWQDRMYTAILQMAFNFVTGDMVRHTQERLARAAERFSARGAAA